MSEAVAAAPRIALVGQPNCGKTSLFNLLTGARQKVANYAGVTVERKAGQFQTPRGRSVHIIDLPGTYALEPRSPDEAVTAKVLRGEMAGESQPDLIVCVLEPPSCDATCASRCACAACACRWWSAST